MSLDFRYCKLCNKLVYNYTEIAYIYGYANNGFYIMCKCLKCFSKSNHLFYDRKLSSIHIQECKIKEFIINNAKQLGNIITLLKYNTKLFDYIKCIDRFSKSSNDDIVLSLIDSNPLLLYWYKDRSEEFEMKVINSFVICDRYDLIKEHLLFESARNYLNLINL